MYTNLLLSITEGLWDLATWSGNFLEALFVGTFKFTEAFCHWGFWYADSLLGAPAPHAI